jgi:thiol-disulfide isomerase/thioredoxin
MNKKIITTIIIILIIGIIIVLEVDKPKVQEINVIETSDRVAEKNKNYELAKEITTPDGFVNTESININDLVGKKVILVDFWTYSCINCQRTMPYLNAWYEKYRDQGLEIIGIHTPEFKFEHEYANVVDAVERFAIKHPVVLDNDFSTWRAYKNQYWPRKYLIDIDGFIVYDHIGEGAYEETERKIQELLEERRSVFAEAPTDKRDQGEFVQPENTEQVDFGSGRSPEIYFGAWRNQRLGNGQAGKTGTETFVAPDDIKSNELYLVGEWNINQEFAENLKAGDKIVFKYKAAKVFMVAGSPNGTKVKLLRDGQSLGGAAGAHVSEDSTLEISQEQLYRLVEDSAGFGEHTLEIIIEEPGLQAFTFTFG